MAECIFCGIIEGNIPAEKVYEDELVTAFKDIHAQAPVHILVIPNQHIPSIQQIGEGDSQLPGRFFSVINQLAQDYGLAERGYRIVNNCGEDGGQTVHHIHFHLLGARHLTWPPG
ncbi:histidine triad (HIT) family protein [Marininema mesophilum]|uniref:Histidine triad (HIT) family protein n=1 Tax=Marininema mesophilum TaxID=1048340 RepID=A0A1H2R6Y2_9BACL|nr:histidine triad nucleotide-binding protein [Marininema mesophilum]SDW14890.1 histidine triad (HIT) family protein [Marininema mesophilum]